MSNNVRNLLLTNTGDSFKQRDFLNLKERLTLFERLRDLFTSSFSN